LAATTIQRHFERPGPLDPRYRMIDHLAPKFRSTSLAHAAVHEPRAAFLLNRFSDQLPILYATPSAQFVLSCDSDESVGRSFFEYIDEPYLLGTVNAISRAKENDSIAYLRVLWKPLLDQSTSEEEEEEEEMPHEYEGEDEEESQHDLSHSRSHQQTSLPPVLDRYEVECLVSASSDGLIVVVRRAPPIEGLAPHVRPPGVFASPWASSPLAPYTMTPPPPSPVDAQSQFDEAVQENIPHIPGPTNQEVMNSIRDVTVFAWSISMLNDDVSQDNAANMVDGEVYPEEENARATPEEDR